MPDVTSRGTAGRPRWLVIAPQLPRPDHASGDRRLFAMLEVLAGECALSIATTSARRDDAEAYEAALVALGIEVLGYGSWQAIRAMIAVEFDTIFFEFHGSAHGLLHFVDTLQPQARVIVDSVDLHYLRTHSASLIGAAVPHAAGALKESELAVYRRADLTLVVTESEREELRAEGVTDCLVVPNIVPLLPRTRRERQPDVLFIGGFRHTPNGAAVHWFARDIWPRIRTAIPEARWTIAGSDTPADILALDGRDGICVRGFVASTAPLLDAAQVSVAPLTFGAGMKGKVSEALAAGVPVVTTRWGAQGLDADAGTAFHLADDPADFATAVIHLLTNAQRRDELSRNGQQLALGLCSSDVARPVLRALTTAPQRAMSSRKVRTRVVAFVALVVKRRIVKLRQRDGLAVRSR